MIPYWLVINSDFHTTEPYSPEQTNLLLQQEFSAQKTSILY